MKGGVYRMLTIHVYDVFRFKLTNGGFPLMTGNVLTPRETIIPLTYP